MAAEHPSISAPSAGADDHSADQAAHDRASLTSTLPPTPLHELLAAEGAGVSVYVLSTDPALLDVVQRAGGEHYSILPLQTWPQLEAAIHGERCNVALLDADELGKSLARRLAELDRHSGRLVTLVAATRDQSQQLMGYLSDRKIHRLLIKPAALGITRLLLESAIARCLQVRAHEAAPPPLFADDRRPLRTLVSGAARWPTWALAAGLVSVTIGVLVAVGLVRSLSQSPAPSAVPSRLEDVPAEATLEVRAPEIVTTGEQVAPVRPGADVDLDVSPDANRFAELLERAGTALSQGRLAEPGGDNALELYLAILAAEPNHERARGELAVVIDALFTRAESALLDDDLALAADTLDQVRRAEPSSARLAFLEAQLERSRSRAEEEAAAVRAVGVPEPPQPEAAEAAGELERLLARAGELIGANDLERATVLRDTAAELGAGAAALAPLDRRLAAARARAAAAQQTELYRLGAERLASGALIAPADDSALHYLAALRAENPDHPELAAAWQTLTDGIAANANAAFAAGDWSGTDAWLEAWRNVAPGAAAAERLANDLAAERRQQQFLATAVPASVLALLEHRAPEYPAGAVRTGTEGWVSLEFVVGRDGRPRDLEVVESMPSGRFDQAAVAAVRDYVYEPFELDGRLYERRVRLRLSFTLR